MTEKEKITREMTIMLAKGYNKVRSVLTEQEFNELTAECISAILELQYKMGKEGNFVRAGLLLIAHEDPNDTFEETQRIRDILKASIVQYLITKDENMFKELGLNISMF